MVEFNQKLDRNNKLYIPKLMREAGFDSMIKIRPNDNAAVIYPSRIQLTDVKASIEAILMDIENILRKEKEKASARGREVLGRRPLKKGKG